jgi:hypothetical protein
MSWGGCAVSNASSNVMANAPSTKPVIAAFSSDGNAADPNITATFDASPPGVGPRAMELRLVSARSRALTLETVDRADGVSLKIEHFESGELSGFAGCSLRSTADFRILPQLGAAYLTKRLRIQRTPHEPVGIRFSALAGREPQLDLTPPGALADLGGVFGGGKVTLRGFSASAAQIDGVDQTRKIYSKLAIQPAVTRTASEADPIGGTTVKVQRLRDKGIEIHVEGAALSTRDESRELLKTDLDRLMAGSFSPENAIHWILIKWVLGSLCVAMVLEILKKLVPEK